MQAEHDTQNAFDIWVEIAGLRAGVLRGPYIGQHDCALDRVARARSTCGRGSRYAQQLYPAGESVAGPGTRPSFTGIIRWFCCALADLGPVGVDFAWREQRG